MKGNIAFSLSPCLGNDYLDLVLDACSVQAIAKAGYPVDES